MAARPPPEEPAAPPRLRDENSLEREDTETEDRKIQLQSSGPSRVRFDSDPHVIQQSDVQLRASHKNLKFKKFRNDDGADSANLSGSEDDHTLLSH